MDERDLRPGLRRIGKENPALRQIGMTKNGLRQLFETIWHSPIDLRFMISDL